MSGEKQKDMSEKLYTSRMIEDFERVVYLHIVKSNNELPYINDEDTCKMVLVSKGTLKLEVTNKNGNENIVLGAPGAIFISPRDKIKLDEKLHFRAITVFFRPSVINDMFTYDDMYGEKYEGQWHTTVYQDYLTVRNFFAKDGLVIKYCKLTNAALARLMELMAKMEHELTEPYDGYWPCRSRSFFIEMLFFLNFLYSENPITLERKDDFTNVVIEYLNSHINEKIELEMLTKEFNVNRNLLNKMFVEQTGLTCLAYLLKLRLDVAKLMLTETELPISEIGARVGFLESNYFTKVFKKECQMTPSAYREKNSTFRCPQP